MIKRNIAIGILIIIIVAIFTVAIMTIMPKGKKEEIKQTYTNQPVMRVSDFIEEAVYMGSYSSDTEIFTDEPAAAKDVLRSALAKSSGLPENVTVMIESHNYDDLSVVYDDGQTMRTFDQPGTTSVYIVALIPKLSGDVYYAYSVQVKVKESEKPAETTEEPKVSKVTRAAVTTPAWKWENYEEVTTEVTTKQAGKTTTAVTAAATAAATKPVTKPEPTEAPVTEPPAPPSATPEPQAPPEPVQPPSDPEPQQPSDPGPADPGPPPEDAGQE